MKISKTQKLEWIRAARISTHERASLGRPAFTCWAFGDVGGDKAVSWYSNLTLSIMGVLGERYDGCLHGFDFGSNNAERNAARLMWLAMLETLVKEGVIE